MEAVYRQGRDNARTPMQWNDGLHAGFSAHEPWMQVNPNYLRIHVAGQLEDPGSILNYYKRLIRLRKDRSVCIDGSYDLLLPEHEQVYVYTRTSPEEVLLVLCSFSPMPCTLQLPAHLSAPAAELLACNYDEGTERLTAEGIVLRPYEARVYSIRSEKGS